MTQQFETVALNRSGALARVELNRPDRLNAIGMRGARELVQVAELIAGDDTLRLVAIVGKGRAFSAGIDLKELSSGLIEQEYFDLWERALRTFETMDKLVLCLIQGYALGGGLQLALASDIRVCTPSAKLGLPAIKEGLIPGLGTWRLARYVGLGRSKSLILGGKVIDGEEARRIGLVDHLVTDRSAADTFEDWILEYARSNSAGCRQAKVLLSDCFDCFEAFLGRYLERQQQSVGGPDFAEAMSAFREDRTPNWK